MSPHSANGTYSASDDKDDPSALVFPVCRNQVLRLGLESILSETGFTVWHEIIDGFSCLPAIRDEPSALFIIDAGSFTCGAIDLVRRLKAHAPAARIVIVADAFDPAAVPAAWETGVHGFCLSSHGRDVFIKSLELVMLGEAVLPATIVLPSGRTDVQDARHVSMDGTHRGKPKASLLSNRESEILTCLRDGDPNKVIARKLNLSEATVKVHVKTILKKIGACNRTQAALWASGHVSLGPKPLQTS